MKFLKYFSIHKSIEWYWKPTVVTHKKAVGVFRYEGSIDDSVCPSHIISTDKYAVQHGLMIQCIQVFWLKLIFAVSTPHETEGYGKEEYVEVKPVKQGDKIQLCYKDNTTPCDCNGLCKNSC